MFSGKWESRKVEAMTEITAWKRDQIKDTHFMDDQWNTVRTGRFVHAHEAQCLANLVGANEGCKREVNGGIGCLGKVELGTK